MLPSARPIAQLTWASVFSCRTSRSGTLLAHLIFARTASARSTAPIDGGRMDGQALANRVENLEKTVDELRQLPARMEAVEERIASCEGHILQLQTEMRDEFSSVREEAEAFRAETRAEFGAVRDEMRMEFAAGRSEMAAGFARVNELFAKVNDRFARIDDEFVKVRKEIRLGDEETRRYMRVLHEDLAERITILGNELGGNGSRRPPRKG
jgi:chromosome segregation ATPase